jgi:hypothetical protein
MGRDDEKFETSEWFMLRLKGSRSAYGGYIGTSDKRLEFWYALEWDNLQTGLEYACGPSVIT